MLWQLCRKLSDRERNCVFKDALQSEDASKTNAAKKLCVDCAKERGETISLHPTAALEDPTPKRKRRSSSLKIEPPTTPRGSKPQGTYGSPPVTPNKEVATLIEQLDAWLEWNRLWVKLRHCVQRKMAVEHCLNSMHVKNNVKILVLADKAQS